QVDVRASYTILGTHCPTSGIMPLIAARWLWWMGSWAIGAGFNAGAFGLGSSAHGVVVLAGPVLSAGSARGRVSADMGRCRSVPRSWLRSGGSPCTMHGTYAFASGGS